MYQLLPHLRSELRLNPEAGKIHVITGENGIGKSTYLKYHALNFLPGTFIFSEQRALDVFFDRPLSRFREILIEDSESCHRELFHEFWKKSGLEQKESRLLSQLSGGENQLLKLISQCSAIREFYLLDEPGQYLDREKKNLVAELFQTLIRINASILAIDHDTNWFPPGTTIHELHQESGVLIERRQWTI